MLQTVIKRISTQLETILCSMSELNQNAQTTAEIQKIENKLTSLSHFLNLASIYSHPHVSRILDIANTADYINALLKFTINEHNGNDVLMNLAQTPTPFGTVDNRPDTANVIIKHFAQGPADNALQFFGRRNNENNTAFMLAIINAPEIAKAILAIVNDKQPSHWSHKNKNNYVRDILTAKNKQNKTPLMLAFEQNPGLTELILLKASHAGCLGEVLRPTNQKGHNILMQALLGRDLEPIKIALKFAFMLECGDREFIFIAKNILDQVLISIKHCDAQSRRQFISPILDSLNSIDFALHATEADYLLQIYDQINELKNKIQLPQTDPHQLITLLKFISQDSNCNSNLSEAIQTLCQENEALKAICREEYRPTMLSQ